MKVADGDFYDGSSSRRTPAELHHLGSNLLVQAESRSLLPATAIEEVEISSRLGNTPRYLGFPGGATFETGDNDAIDRLLTKLGVSSRALLLHRLESHKRFILVSLLLVVLFVWSLVQYGIPAMSRSVAFSLPPSASAMVGEGVLEFLDHQLFSPSGLSQQRQTEIRAAFAPTIERYRGAFDIEVLFRRGERVGANAMALPSGTIIFTDELVTLAQDDRELVAVLAHEIGHVRGRHSLRQAIQSSVFSLLIVSTTGDVSALSSLVTTIPVILAELGYSRDFEREADRFALKVMQESRIPPHLFIDILQRIERSHFCGDAAGKGGKPETACRELPAGDEHGVGDYLSTHPPTAERARLFM